MKLIGCVPTRNTKLTVKLSIACDSTVEPVARSHSRRWPVMRRSARKMLMSSSWPMMNAVSDATNRRAELPNAVWKTSFEIGDTGLGGRWRAIWMIAHTNTAAPTPV